MSSDSPKRDPWNKRGDESAKAFEAFNLYLELGAQRTVVKVSEKCGKHVSMLYRWSRRYQWDARCDAWEDFQDAEWVKERQRSIREACRRHTLIAKSMTGKVTGRLKKIDPEELSPSDLARWLDTAVKIERQALGLSTGSHELTGKDGSAVEIMHEAKQRLAGLLGSLVAESEEGEVAGEPKP
jgi:hypothetical protein